ncbi:uncharacterized protein LOC128243551 [Mya arenaria]|uniref:uncharacterized protein LOC128243551 n=1 Tax=Mya arenaria TaxID=6604 RepID=UPI0022E86D9C|nr:uncharacterized protein LOC128243551 [Mya arenaria]
MANLQGTALTKENIEGAFRQVKDLYPVPEGEVRLVSPEIIESAIRFIRDSFVKDEPVGAAFGIQWDDNADGFWRHAFSEGLSLAVVSANSGQVIAIRGIAPITRGVNYDVPDSADDRLKRFLSYMNYCHEKSNFFQHYDIQEALHFFGLGVHEAYRRKGIATKLFQTALAFVKSLGLDKVYVKGESSSDFSRRIYDKFGFELLLENFYKDCTFAGAGGLKVTGGHAAYSDYGKCITNE